ncbi:hypothetical protein ACLEQD_34135, partial [Corallococcus sp. 4LFB]
MPRMGLLPRRNALLLFALATVLALGTACPSNHPSPPDGGTQDAGSVPDSGVEPPDAGTDAGAPDASVACAPPEDAGAPW